MTIHSRIPSQALAAPAPLTQALRIAIEYLGKGQYRAFDATDGSPTKGHVIIERATEPLLDAARVLLGRGHDPKATLEMSRKATPDRVDMRGRLGTLAKLSVNDSPNSSPRFVEWKPSPFSLLRKEIDQ